MLPGTICANEVPKKIIVTSVVCQFNLPPGKFNPQAVQSCGLSNGRKQNYKTSAWSGRLAATDVTRLLQNFSRKLSELFGHRIGEAGFKGGVSNLFL